MATMSGETARCGNSGDTFIVLGLQTSCLDLVPAQRRGKPVSEEGRFPLVELLFTEICWPWSLEVF